MVEAFSFPPPQPRPSLEELWPRAADARAAGHRSASRRARRRSRQAVVRPMEVFEHEHEWALLGECLEESPPRGEGLATAVAAQPGIGLEADKRAEVRLDPAGVVRVVDGIPDCEAKLLCGLVLGIPFLDPGLRLHDLGQRPERDAVAVGEAASLPPGNQVCVWLDDLREELVNEAALSDAGNPDESDQLRCSRRAGSEEGVPRKPSSSSRPTSSARA